jgi:5-oxoprolinase (ATP-hydrolysing)
VRRFPEILNELINQDEEKATRDLQKLYDEGYRSIAIALVHSYLYPIHEQRVEAIARQIGFEQISVSSSLQAMINLVSRGGSATADAYLTPEVKRYLNGFSKGFIGGLSAENGCRTSFMQSDGALCDHRSFSGLKAILSGPAGGVVGFAKTSYDPRDGSPVVGFDMGGTSTDVSRFGGKYEHVFETTTAGVTIQTPQLDINTVAAGGGSILSYRNGLLAVGPESAGAHPGPACYRKGGPLTVTDANVFLGRIHIDSFPKIFGPTEDQPLDYDIVKSKFEALTRMVNSENKSNLTPAQVAAGFIDVANASMGRPIRALTEQRGFRTGAHILACFGGAGGQHACALAGVLGIPRVIVHKYSSLLSAFGMALADVAVENSEPFNNRSYSQEVIPAVEERFVALEGLGREQLLSQGIPKTAIRFERYLNLRYRGSDTRIMIQKPDDGDFAASFVKRHKREFAFNLEVPIDIDTIRVRAAGLGEQGDHPSPFVKDLEALPEVPIAKDAHFATNEIFFEQEGKFITSPLYRLDTLAPGTAISGPAVLLDQTQTILLHPQNKARILTNCV